MVKKNLIEKYQPPEADSLDTAHLVTKAALSIVPGAPDLFEYFVKPPLEKRLDNWRHEISTALRNLEKANVIKLEDLQKNELFLSIVIQATHIATRNHQKEKLESLRNAIENSALSSNNNEDSYLIFLQYIDELTPSHLKVLKFFLQGEKEIAQISSYTDLYNLFINIGSNNHSREEFKLMCGDLINRGLIRISSTLEDFEDLYEPDRLIAHNPEKDGILPKIIVTNIAHNFFQFISSKNQL